MIDAILDVFILVFVKLRSTESNYNDSIRFSLSSFRSKRIFVFKSQKEKNPERLYPKIYIIRRKYVLHVAFTTSILFGNFNRFALIVCRKWTITLGLILLQFCLPIASMVCLTVQRLMLLKVYFLTLFIEMVPDYTYLILLRVAMYNGFYVPMIYINCPTINSLILLIISRLQNRSQDDCNDFLWF